MWFASRRQPVHRLDFIVAGAQKSGTTALNYYLKRHPEIALPRRKELHFFDDDARFSGAQVNYHSLHEMFPPARPGSVAGENTPNYLYFPAAMPRIHAYNAAIKLIFVLRNPITRAFSQWNMQRARGLEPLDFLPALRAEEKRLRELSPQEARRFAYVDRGRYRQQLDRVFALFPREQVLVLKYEEFRAAQRAKVEAVFRFLGVRVPARFKAIEAHSIAYERSMREDERAAVRDLLREEIAGLEKLLGWNCSDWR